MDYNYSGLGWNNSSTIGNLPSQNGKVIDYFSLNVSYSGRNNSINHDLNRQPTNMSQASVGQFRVIKSNGDIFVNQFLNTPTQDDFLLELDRLMFNKSINVYENVYPNNMQVCYNENGSNQEKDSMQKSIFKNQLMNISASSRKYFDDINQDYSAQVRQSMNNLFPVDSTQFQNENMLNHLNDNFKLNMPSNLIYIKQDGMSELEKETKHQYNLQFSNEGDHQNKDCSTDELDIKYENNSCVSFQNQNDFNNIQNKNEQQTSESINPGITIEPFKFIGSNQQEISQTFSDEEDSQKKKLPLKTKTITHDQKKQQKGSQYRQSRHKNVFKNFGGTLVRYIQCNEYFQDRVITELQKDAEKQKKFLNWLQTEIKLERKKDFQIGWTIFQQDSQEIKEYKCLLKELSRDFFENFSFIYLINSKKISDMEIHLRSIHTYLAAINNPDSLERFKPV